MVMRQLGLTPHTVHKAQDTEAQGKTAKSAGG